MGCSFEPRCDVVTARITPELAAKVKAAIQNRPSE
jgi:hypothetical protein